MLFTYYAFLLASLVVSLVFNSTTGTKGPRTSHVSFLLVAPLILLTTVSNLGFVGVLLLSVAVIFIGKSIFKRYADAEVTRETLYYSFALVLLEAAIPATIHFGLRLSPDAERWSLLTASLALLSATILFGVLAPDVHKNA